MKDLTKYFIDLSKCSEEQWKSLPQILVKNRQEYTPAFNDNISASDIVHFHNTWKIWALSVGIPDDKTELTYPEFIKLFEGGEGEKKCCDNPDIQWNKIEIFIGDKQGSYKDLNFNFCDNCGETFNEAFD